ncbi:MAG: DNA repair protein RadA [Chloroflexi bacterium]|nr:DNA repair protein RadA [Chloroflexota bacterium]
MARAKTKVKRVYVCQSCGADSLRWAGRCTSCGEWNTLKETVLDTAPRRTHTSRPASVPQKLSDVQADNLQRLTLPLPEFGRVLGGGIVPGSLVLVGGDPGIGKSTLLLQVAGLLSQQGNKVLYVSGEESVHQIKMRAKRLGIESDSLYLLSETNLDMIIQHTDQLGPSVLIVDSIQTVYLGEITSSAGSVSQVRECTTRLLQMAKAENIPIFLVGHVTKAGTIAGPRVLEHIVDTVLYLEGDRFHAYRLLRSAKNRFGSTHEVGVFEMASQGMVEVLNPSQVFLAEHRRGATGSTVAVTMEGTRPLLVEVQALTSTTSFNLPRRTANGIDLNRLLLLVAVLNKRVGLRLFNQDVFVNVIGGLRINEPAADLAVALAICSSFRDAPVQPDLAIVGEIGLGGELRSVSQTSARLREAAKLGFSRCIVPKGSRIDTGVGLELIRLDSVAKAVDVALVS